MLVLHLNCLMRLIAPGGTCLPTCPLLRLSEKGGSSHPGTAQQGQTQSCLLPTTPPVIGGWIRGALSFWGCWLRWAPLPGLWMGAVPSESPGWGPALGFWSCSFSHAAFD